MLLACCRTCLDQGSVVVFADEFNPAKPDHISVPSLDMSNIMVRPQPVTTENIKASQSCHLVNIEITVYQVVDYALACCSVVCLHGMCIC